MEALLTYFTCLDAAILFFFFFFAVYVLKQTNSTEPTENQDSFHSTNYLNFVNVVVKDIYSVARHTVRKDVVCYLKDVMKHKLSELMYSWLCLLVRFDLVVSLSTVLNIGEGPTHQDKCRGL